MASNNRGSYLKACIKNKDEEKTVYCHLPMLFINLQASIKSLIPEENLNKYRIYWIDEDGDEIQIDNGSSYDIFLERAIKKKVFVQEKSGNASASKLGSRASPQKVTFETEATAAPAGGGDKSVPEHGSVHEKIECDACGQSPIVGFRYKCIQCPNFDLCMKCESKLFHKHHLMIRFPNPVNNRLHIHRKLISKLKKFSDIEEHVATTCAGGGDEPRERHSRRGRQCKNMFTNFYTMMNDLAEGTDAHYPSAPTCPFAAPYSSAPQKKPETTEETNTDNANGNVVQDPHYAKIGIEILNNFSEMFSKMLNPLDISVEVDVKAADEVKNNEKTDNVETQTTAENNNDKKSEEKTSQTGSDAASNESEKSSLNNQENGQVASAADASSVEPENMKKKDSIGDEQGWTVIDKSIEERSPSPKPSAPEDVAEEGAVGGSAIEEEQQSVNYAKLSQDLWEHIKNDNTLKKDKEELDKKEAEKKKEKEKQKVRELRAQIVYHPKPHINNAVIAMVAMGFSNDGNWLTQLLESVNGNIDQALDLMKPVK